MTTLRDTPEVTVELIKRHDRPGPRYTSYPTANEFTPAFGPDDYLERLTEADARTDEPLSLYVHLPFCKTRCSFCACNVVITRREDVVRRYLEYLEREISMIAQRLPHRRQVIQYHWGGGTPTHLTPEQMRALQAVVRTHFTVRTQSNSQEFAESSIDEDAEVAVEVHPRVTTHEHIDVLRELGFNRLSMGVQDFDPVVQKLVNRNQTEEQTRELFEYSRRAGFDSINFDLIYGLPQQTPESFARTISSVIEMRPERIACYSYAFVPWIKPHQKAITQEMLPPGELKIQLFLIARRMFLEAGYEAIGMDHFAVPEDELARAASQGVLHRNFMGYTTKRAPDMIAVGISGIGDIGGAYAQNTKKLSVYYAALDAGRPPIERGFRLSEDDQVRRFVITALMCNMQVRFAEVERRFGIAFEDYFREELEQLQAPEGAVCQGFAEITPEGIFVQPLGRLFIRNIAMHFDAYLKRKHAEHPVFSRTV